MLLLKTFSYNTPIILNENKNNCILQASAIIAVVDQFTTAYHIFPDYKLHLNISRTPLFLPKIWGKFIDKLHLSISRTLFCYFLAHRNVLRCIHVMRRSAKEQQDAIDVVQKTLHAGLIAWAKVCGDAVI